MMDLPITRQRFAVIMCRFMKNAYLIHQDNAGQNAARFTGLSHSRGDYILFVDSDDCIRRDCLWRLNDVIRKTGADVVYFDYQEGISASYISTLL